MTPDNHEPNTPGGGPGRGYYGGQSGDDSAYAPAGYGDSPGQRTFRECALIIRERVWYLLAVFLAVFLASLFYTLSRTKLYTATATVEILRRDLVVMKVEEVRDSEMRGPEDLNTQVKLLESGQIIQEVSKRLTGAEARAFLAPYEKGGSGDPIAPAALLGLNRKVAPVRLTRIIAVQYVHPDPEVAAKVANLFVDEFINYNARQRVGESMKAVEDLKSRAETQSKKVQELGINLQAYKERNNMVSLDQRKDIVTEKLKALNLQLTQSALRLKEAEVRWNQVQAIIQRSGNLTELSFIAAQPIIQNLTQHVAAQKITVAQLEQRYRAKHPKMNEAVQSLVQTESELNSALAIAASTIRTDFEAARSSQEQAVTDLDSQQTEALRLDRLGVEYQSLHNELTVNETLLASIIARMRETTMSASIETQNARVVDRAGAPRSSDYSSPNYLLNIALGVFGGLGLGLAFVFFVAFIDDCVKSAFDIESVIGLPLIGIVPQIRRMDTAEKAQIVVSQADPQVAEAFLTLHSSLRLKDGSKKAKVMLVTSTTPSEGKSFIASNLALTFASHGDRTILVDCDLRKPSVHKSFGEENLRGVIDYCTTGSGLDPLIIRARHPNFDLLLAGGRAKNPTQLLNSKHFEALLLELRARYDRVVIDTPPVAAVSDALLILPLVDGSIYTIMFNHVRRKAAQFCARRLLDTNVPCFGAVLNALNLSVSGYYYAQYYDKSYKDYYVTRRDPTDRER